MSTKRKRTGGWVTPESLPKGPNGRALCRYCGSEAPLGRRTFCSSRCVEQWRLQTDPGFLREEVFARDRGYCAVCHTDTVRVFQWIKKLRGAARVKALRDWGIEQSHRRSLWDADHIVPVSEGGGECDLSNMRTLCLKCHRQATNQLRSRLMTAKTTDSDVQT